MCAGSTNFKRVISETTISLSSFLNKVLGVESPQVLMGPATTELMATQNPGASERQGPGPSSEHRDWEGSGRLLGPERSHPPYSLPQGWLSTSSSTGTHVSNHIFNKCLVRRL